MTDEKGGREGERGERARERARERERAERGKRGERERERVLSSDANISSSSDCSSEWVD
jgi:hypothetical protein